MYRYKYGKRLWYFERRDKMLKNNYGHWWMEFIYDPYPPKRKRIAKKYVTYKNLGKHFIDIQEDLDKVNPDYKVWGNSRWRAVRNAYNGRYK